MSYTKKEYMDYVDRKSKKSPIVRDTILAFIIGGLICTVGQAFSELYSKVFNLDKELVKTAVPVTMIFLGALFTALNLCLRLYRLTIGHTTFRHSKPILNQRIHPPLRKTIV